jgi:hypothetical protein
MTPVRALPIHLPPVPGEALDSWLEAYAARLATPLGQMREVLGLSRSGNRLDSRGHRTDWTVHLTEAEISQLTAVTRLSASAVAAMTLSSWNRHAIIIDTATRRIEARKLWSRAHGSRYCPTCLAESDGRWQLSWRLTWQFACLQHRRLLIASCPRCHRMPRQSPHPLRVLPTPGACGLPTRETPSGNESGHRPRCGYPLAAATETLPEAPEWLLATQTIITDALNNRPGQQLATGIYRHHPVETVEFLGDLRTLAGMIFRLPTPEILARWADPQLMSRYHAELDRAGVDHAEPGPARPRIAPEKLIPIDAAATGLVLTAAMHVLTADDITTAANRLRPIIEQLDARQPFALRHSDLARRFSPPLQAAILRTRDHQMQIVQRLRHRSSSAPRPVTCQTTTAARRAACLPGLLWTAAALPLIPLHDRGARRWRLALPVCLLLTGSQTTLPDAVHLLGDAAGTPRTVHRIHAKIRAHPSGATILRALSLIADELDQHGTPIDYHRRRKLFAHRTNFITLSQWETPQTRRRGSAARTLIHARRWLYETLTGNPIEAAPPPLTIHDYRTRTAYSEFRMRLLPDELALLRTIGTDELARLAIHEPLSWQPLLQFPPELRAELPGPDVDDINISAVHQLFLNGPWVSAKTIAAACGTSSEHIRHVLDHHPVDRPIA